MTSPGTRASFAAVAPPHLIEEAVRREAPALLAYLVRRVTDPADAADLLGDVLVVVWRRAAAMPLEAAAARMWMFGIARKVLAGSRRSTRRRNALTARLHSELIVAGAPADLAGQVARTVDPRVDLLHSALDQLSPADREILSLVHWDSFSVSEAAQHLGLRPSTGRSRYHRARLRLKRLFEDQCGALAAYRS